MRSRTKAAWLFLLPTLIFYAVFLIFPVISSLYLSFREWNMLTPPFRAESVGLGNYAHIFREDPVFLKTLLNTLVFVVTSVPLSIALLFVFVTDTIVAWQVFDFIVAMTAPTLGKAGGPVNSTMTLVVHMYQTAFEYMKMGRASAMAYVLFFIVMGISLLQLRAFGRGGVESY
ncbi:MAG: hypothetical protein VB144_01525 [Clostridia bacterium]|nr:hypothetical protein [Clostridia bacterium]